MVSLASCANSPVCISFDFRYIYFPLHLEKYQFETQIIIKQIIIYTGIYYISSHFTSTKSKRDINTTK